jgi:hypothetical protein
MAYFGGLQLPLIVSGSCSSALSNVDALRFVMTCDLGSWLLSELSEIVFDELAFSA